MTNDKDITLADIFAHMRGQSITINRIDKRLDGVDKRLNGIDDRLNGIDKKLQEINIRFATLESNVNLLFSQTKNLTDELDHVETIDLPQIRKSVRKLGKKISDHTSSPYHQPVLQA